MIHGLLFAEDTLSALKVGVEGTNRRHEAISNNIANVDTPTYQRATVSFEDQLRRVLSGQGFIGKRSHPAHFIIGGPEEIALVRPRVDIESNTRFRPDKNNVNIDEEMANLAENTQMNTAFTELLTRRYANLRNVIQTAGQL